MPIAFILTIIQFGDDGEGSDALRLLRESVSNLESLPAAL
jgi:hypothetical protein